MSMLSHIPCAYADYFQGKRLHNGNSISYKQAKYDRRDSRTSNYRKTSYKGRNAYYGRDSIHGYDSYYYDRRDPYANNYERSAKYRRTSYYEGESRYDDDYRYEDRSSGDYSSEQNSGQAPFPSRISNGNIIKVDLGKLAWGAYDDQGELVKWGRASGGKNYCPDIKRGCRTVTGTYTIYRKQGPECKSSRFPVGKGGAPMPYCMHFKGGYAMHGGQVPNYNASHGCIRLLRGDAEWLNHNFVRVGSTRVNITY